MASDPTGLQVVQGFEGLLIGGLECTINTPCRTLALNTGKAIRGLYTAFTLSNILHNDDVDKNAQTKKPTAIVTGKVCTPGDPNGDPDDDDNKIEHAKQRMGERNISQERIDEAIRIGRAKTGNVPGRTVYDVPSKNSVSGRGIRVVVEDATGKIITVIDKGSKFK